MVVIPDSVAADSAYRWTLHLLERLALLMTLSHIIAFAITLSITSPSHICGLLVVRAGLAPNAWLAFDALHHVTT